MKSSADIQLYRLCAYLLSNVIYHYPFIIVIPFLCAESPSTTTQTTAGALVAVGITSTCVDHGFLTE